MKKIDFRCGDSTLSYLLTYKISEGATKKDFKWEGWHGDFPECRLLILRLENIFFRGDWQNVIEGFYKSIIFWADNQYDKNGLFIFLGWKCKYFFYIMLHVKTYSWKVFFCKCLKN